MNYLCRHIRWVPLLLCLLIPITFFITYGVAVSYGHVEPVWPYISDTGSLSPESCIFAQLLNFAAVLLCVIVYVRYRHVSEYVKLRPSVRITRLYNKICVFLGFLSCLGLDLVANFQESHVLTVHLFGALICFLSGTLYFILQTIFTYLMRHGPKSLLWARIVFSVLTVVFTITTLAPLKEAFGSYKGKDVKLWRSADGGYGYHLVSTISEWLLCFSYSAYVGTFLWEFQNIELLPPVVKLTDVEREKSSADNGTVNPSFDAMENNIAESQWI